MQLYDKDTLWYCNLKFQRTLDVYHLPEIIFRPCQSIYDSQVTLFPVAHALPTNCQPVPCDKREKMFCLKD